MAVAAAAANSPAWHAMLSGPWCPPGVSFCERPKAIAVVERDMARRAASRMTATAAAATAPESCNLPDSICHDSFAWRSQPDSYLLRLPLEVRMHIYEYLHLMNPAPSAKATASPYPMPKPRRCFLRPVRDEQEDTEEDEGEDSEEESGDESTMAWPPLSSAAPPPRCADMIRPDRPASGLPTALLVSCKQIYDESRLVPMRGNEFVFVNWFSSGLWGAHVFLRGLSSWQRAAVRHMRLEMLAAELGGDYNQANGGAGGEALLRWIGLCGQLAGGLRTLRLRIIGSRGLGITPARSIVSVSPPSAVSNGNNGNGNGNGQPAVATHEERRNRELFANEIERCAWVTQGLARLTTLRRLELDMVLPRWTAREKLAWCKGLEVVLRRRGLSTTVVCAERVTEGEWETAMKKECEE
jgi:hypothetical protein